MKKIFLCCFIIILLLTGCETADPKKENLPFEKTSTSGVWISYNDLNHMFLSEKGFLTELDIMIKNCVSIGIEEVYIHVRPFCDSLYPSAIFPAMKNAEGFEGDAFKFILDAFKGENIKVYAWINPYRVQTVSADINSLNHESPVFKWLNDEDGENDINVCFWNGIYLNPAESGAQKLIIDGVREIINNYDVDGIHFDDYFYPTTDSQFDSLSYEKYMSSTDSPLSLADWRRANVNALLSDCYSAIKYINKDVEFSISPAASLQKNYDEFYADVEKWINGGYVDCIIPQLYFGFDYIQNEYRFENLLEAWKNTVGDESKVKLKIGLANYKIGTQNDSDGNEWVNKNDIISRQAEICHNDSEVSGYVFFSYSSLFLKEKPNLEQLENYKEFLKVKEVRENG